MCDAPFVSYKNEDTEGGENKHTAKEMQELTRRWEEKRKAQEAKGQKVSLNDFLVNGVDALKRNTK
jgi:hypothetical protein